ncbi:MAG: hypothetical protein JWM21_3700 [Acidobacteria bacterium]|nr:hypothetical protein [Acidobacteriota bacterium]
MLASRQSGATRPNDKIQELEPLNKRENNLQWLERVRALNPKATDGVVMFGGASPSHFRIRVAQSHVRSDLLPSYWSLAGLFKDDKSFVSVPLEICGDISETPNTNGVQTCSLADYKDPQLFPNVAVLRFADNPEFVFSGPEKQPPERSIVESIQGQRGIIDLPALIVAWLGYVWAVGERGNPLLAGIGLPGSAFVATAYGTAGIEMAPGLSSGSICPEAIWHAAKWWQSFYDETSGARAGQQAIGIVPTGYFVIRQPAAAADVEAPKKKP